MLLNLVFLKKEGSLEMLPSGRVPVWHAQELGISSQHPQNLPSYLGDIGWPSSCLAPRARGQASVSAPMWLLSWLGVGRAGAQKR